MIPWGRFKVIRADLLQGGKLTEDGGTGLAKKFYDWANGQIEQYL